MSDAEILRRLAELVRAGAPVPDDLQAQANEAIVRAVDAKKLPTRGRGRPSKAAGTFTHTELTLAITLQLLLRAGHGKALVAATLADEVGPLHRVVGVSDPSTVLKYAKKAADRAAELIALYSPDPGEDRLAKEATPDELRAFHDAQRADAWADFDSLDPVPMLAEQHRRK